LERFYALVATIQSGGNIREGLAVPRYDHSNVQRGDVV
jgi:hypothetical protein